MNFSINESSLSHDRLDNEVIIVNLETGAYYSGTGSFADLWTLLGCGYDLAQSIHILALTYNTESQSIEQDVQECINHLLDRSLLIENSASPTQSQEGNPLPTMVRGAWTAPTFLEFTDMWELIKLDPVHDVDDSGWPHSMPS